MKINKMSRSKRSHKLWDAKADENGKVIIHRTQAEREDFENIEFTKAVIASGWGVIGATLADQVQFSKIPQAIKNRFNLVAKTLTAQAEAPPRVLSWGELEAAFGAEKVKQARSYLNHGMRTRQASKYLNVPFIVAADLLSDYEKIGRKAMKELVDDCKKPKSKSASKRMIASYGKLANKVIRILKSGSPKFSVDQAAEAYWKGYYGDYGDQMVKEVKKRVKADLAKIWLLKEGVDQAAADYWQNYFSENGYGKMMTEEMPKKLKPKARKAQTVLKKNPRKAQFDEGVASYESEEALKWASSRGQVEVVELLLAAGADVHAQEDVALRQASIGGHAEVVRLLLDAGADVHIGEDEALIEASSGGHTEVVELLLEYGADVHARKDDALKWASEAGQAEVVELLLEYGADVDAQDSQALREASGEGHVEVVKLLLDAGADVHAQDDEALKWALVGGHVEVVKLLLDVGVDIHSKDDALIWASGVGHIELVKLLLDAGADVHAENDGALRDASEKGNIGVVELLLEYGADPSVLE